MKKLLVFVSFAALAAIACPPVDEVDTDAGGGQPDAGTSGAVCTTPSTPIECEDENILQLARKWPVSTGTVTTTESSGVFTSVIDATAGGMNGASTHSFVYVRFTDSGLEKVAIDDDTTFGSLDWDMMARRYVVLLNGGDVGPSCVAAAAASGTFDSVTAAPAGANYREEDLFDSGCVLVKDQRYASQGFDTPDALLKTWWEYPQGCVATSGDVFVLRLASGRLVKLVIDEYYGGGQADCNTMGVMGTNSGMLKLRWAWL